ncbi:MAG: 50S ribosomal protein L17 [Chlamydiae bacterium]|nr:50S ribosomal protein L17 [Chlamydiota bacterium]
MRHLKRTAKFNRNSSHRRCMIANMLKSLVEHGRIETTVPKAKELRRHADRLITLAKKNTLSSRRTAIARLMINFNSLTSKEARDVKKGDLSSYNTDRRVIGKLFDELSQRYLTREGGYTRIVRKENRRGDGTTLCIIEYIQ